MNPAVSQPQYTRKLIGFLHALQPGDLPAEALDRARYFLLDYLSVALRGSEEESARCVQRMIQRMGATGCVTVIGTSIRTLPGLAALANGTASHGIEQDDTHSGGSIHLGTTMYSAALALAESMPETTQPEFLAAVVAGYEAAARIAMAVQPKEHYALGFHPTQTCGVFGAAVTTSRLLGLSAERMLDALGIAGSMAAGSMEFLAEGAWTKRIHPGLAAQNGIHAALLAAEGFSGPQHILEGRDGFLHGYSRNPAPERLTERLGDSFEILRTAVKPHACCRYMQGPIDAILALMREHGMAPAQIERIEVAMLEAGWGIVCEPAEKKYHPESIVDAQFSMPFGAAVAVLCGAAGLDQFTPEMIRSPRVRQMMAKVSLVKDASLETAFPREWPARVTILVASGERHEKFIRYPKGDPENPLSWEEMAAKFRMLAGGVLPEERCERIIEEVGRAKPEAVARLLRI
ncbi:MAG TPA: MmgE/PrpD family protein [Bryobacteraceae bacterium]|jgi:2-methylcitrate dehydratase PrpD